MKIQYVADDGTIFDTEKECREYEKSCKFGLDPRFVSVIYDALLGLSDYNDIGNYVINFQSLEDQELVAVAIAENMGNIYQVYQDMVNAVSIKKALSK